jgi:HD-GYP domain-containing protein (c-di-GMP phosphodiesterase class II)
MAAFLRTGRKDAEAMRMTHCTLASQLASRLGLRESVQDALLQYFERWDGQGEPGDRSGDAIALPVRVVQLADVAEVFHRIGGADAAVEVVRARSGTQFDPEVANAFCTHAGELLAPLGAPASDVVVSAPPGLSTPLSDEESSRVLEAFADFLDLKSPYTLGHSRAVADLAAEAARIAGRPADKVDELRRAGLLHDLGRLGVSNTIWDKAGPLTAAERERVRMQPYLTERMLTASAALAPLGQLAATHQERLDGSGYPRGLKGEALSPEARLLAAADVYQAMREPRAHRAAREPDDAARELRAEVRAGRLDGEAAEAVLRAAGHRASRRPTQPGGLTAREVEVLGLVARGLRSKEIGEQLHITPKTVGHHIGHIYSKIGVTNRAGASLFATEHGLLGQRSEAA